MEVNVAFSGSWFGFDALSIWPLALLNEKHAGASHGTNL